MGKHQIRRIDSYVRLSWGLKRIAGELDGNAAEAESIGAIRADKLSTKRYQTKESYASSVVCVAGSPVTGLALGKAFFLYTCEVFASK